MLGAKRTRAYADKSRLRGQVADKSPGEDSPCPGPPGDTFFEFTKLFEGLLGLLVAVWNLLISPTEVTHPGYTSETTSNQHFDNAFCAVGVRIIRMCGGTIKKCYKSHNKTQK